MTQSTFNPDAYFDRLLWEYEKNLERLAQEEREAEAAESIANHEETLEELIQCDWIAKLLDPLYQEVFYNE